MAYRDELADVRDFVRRHALMSGLSAHRAEDLALAASEVAANTLRHTHDSGRVRIWAQQDELICEFHDTGTIGDPQAGQVKPAVDAGGGLGLWVVRQVCDAVDIQSGPAGTTVRLRMSLGDVSGRGAHASA
jgi:anti-sigma regulatory factor (Ser/Thr protein kinase)